MSNVRVVWVLLMSFLGLAVPVSADTPVCSYEVVASFPHDPQAFTQGLVFHEGMLIEGTGLYGGSTLRRVELESGEIMQVVDLDADLFGEGVAVWQDQILQITWIEELALIWDLDDFAPEGSFTYTGQGWGLTHDGHRLIMSDGSSELVFRDPETFAVQGAVQVTDDGGAVSLLNELEWIRGEVFANQWTTNRIARIDPWTGEVVAWLDLSGLLVPPPPQADVLNGIAWDDDEERLFVTGKRWPTLFEITMTDCPPLALFRDGFERGDLSDWTQPLARPAASTRRGSE